MDKKFLSLIEHAENGSIDALWDLASAYTYGKGVSKDKRHKKRFLLMLSERSDEIQPEGYGILLTIIGDVCFDLKEYDEAADWYMKSIHCFLKYFPIENAKKMIIENQTEENLEDAFYWSEHTQTMHK